MRKNPCHSLKFSSAAISIFVVACCLTSLADAQQFGRRFRGRGPNIPLILSSLREVHEELRLSREQVKFIEALQRDLTAQFGNRGERNAAARVDTKLFATILNRQQVHRFDEIRIQFEGLRAIDREEIRRSLELSDEQHDRLRDLARNRSANRTIEEQLQEVLSDSQLGKWQELSGEEFEFSRRTEELRQMIRRLGRFGRGRRNPEPPDEEPQDSE